MLLPNSARDATSAGSSAGFAGQSCSSAGFAGATMLGGGTAEHAVRRATRVGRGAKPPSEVSAYVERLAQAVADEVDGEHGQREEEAGEEDDAEREVHVHLALGHDGAPRR